MFHASSRWGESAPYSRFAVNDWCMNLTGAKRNLNEKSQGPQSRPASDQAERKIPRGKKVENVWARVRNALLAKDRQDY